MRKLELQRGKAARISWSEVANRVPQRQASCWISARIKRRRRERIKQRHEVRVGSTDDQRHDSDDHQRDQKADQRMDSNAEKRSSRRHWGPSDSLGFAVQHIKGKRTLHHLMRQRVRLVVWSHVLYLEAVLLSIVECA